MGRLRILSVTSSICKLKVKIVFFPFSLFPLSPVSVPNQINQKWIRVQHSRERHSWESHLVCCVTAQTMGLLLSLSVCKIRVKLEIRNGCKTQERRSESEIRMKWSFLIAIILSLWYVCLTLVPFFFFFSLPFVRILAISQRRSRL